jgi:hypothetical protein
VQKAWLLSYNAYIQTVTFAKFSQPHTSYSSSPTRLFLGLGKTSRGTTPSFFLFYNKDPLLLSIRHLQDARRSSMRLSGGSSSRWRKRHK